MPTQATGVGHGQRHKHLGSRASQASRRLEREQLPVLPAHPVCGMSERLSRTAASTARPRAAAHCCPLLPTAAVAVTALRAEVVTARCGLCCFGSGLERPDSCRPLELPPLSVARSTRNDEPSLLAAAAPPPPPPHRTRRTQPARWHVQLNSSTSAAPL